MYNPELLSSRLDCEEGLLMRNIDLARQRLVRRGGELELVLRERSMSRKERMHLLSYAMCGLTAAHDELRFAVEDLTKYEGCRGPEEATQ